MTKIRMRLLGVVHQQKCAAILAEEDLMIA